MKKTLPFLFILLSLSPNLFAATKTAIVAGGCFWCIEADYEKLDGVLTAVSGYINGHLKNPTYKEVSRGGTGHTEAVKIEYDDTKLTYQQILKHFWINVDPTRDDGQFCDSGSQYRPGIYYLNETQQKLAEESMANIEATKTFSEPLKVELASAGKFYVAESYHQDYYKKNPVRYKYYRFGCRRDARLEDLWGDKS